MNYIFPLGVAGDGDTGPLPIGKPILAPCGSTAAHLLFWVSIKHQFPARNMAETDHYHNSLVYFYIFNIQHTQQSLYI